MGDAGRQVVELLYLAHLLLPHASQTVRRVLEEREFFQEHTEQVVLLHLHWKGRVKDRQRGRQTQTDRQTDNILRLNPVPRSRNNQDDLLLLWGALLGWSCCCRAAPGLEGRGRSWASLLHCPGDEHALCGRSLKMASLYARSYNHTTIG